MPKLPKKEREEAEMFKKQTVIEVFYHSQKVGRLALLPDRYCLFEYDNNWLQNGFSISPFYLPLKGGVFNARLTPFNGLFGVFNDSLPDGWGHLLIDRWLISKGFELASLSVIDRLSLIGDSGMGALTYRLAQMAASSSEVKSLDYYANEVEKILNENRSASLNELVDKAGSSGGARPKVLINIDGEEWLVKFRSSFDPQNVGETEYHYSLLAKKCGIEMTETRLFEGKYFGTRRFDRVNGDRVHVHSGAGLLYADYRIPSLDYTSLMKATLTLTKDINEVEKLFRLMVFNVLIGNKDDHAKNFSFVYDKKQWKLSPAYDLLPSGGFNNQHTTTVNGNGNPDINDCLEVARVCSFPVKRAREVVEEIKEELKN
ncbi:MAG: type II toxin-antitoxin system HipA family toxin [Prolixibacteraceae bacterium]|jgi:serine/threonine-protein kinase HipA|nr:type II toxin-antitoxin system HipA family toxin [Prolixibacteraceae bacterium]